MLQQQDRAERSSGIVFSSVCFYQYKLIYLYLAAKGMEKNNESHDDKI